MADMTPEQNQDYQKLMQQYALLTQPPAPPVDNGGENAPLTSDLLTPPNADPSTARAMQLLGEDTEAQIPTSDTNTIHVPTADQIQAEELLNKAAANTTAPASVSDSSQLVPNQLSVSASTKVHGGVSPLLMKLIKDASTPTNGILQNKPLDGSIDAGKGNNPVEQLKEAQRQRQAALAGADVTQGLMNAGAAIAHVAPNEAANNLIEAQRNQANNIVGDLKDRLAMADKDPNSSTSQAFKQYLNHLGIKTSGDFTAEMGKDLLPSIFKEFEQQQNLQTKQYEAEENRKARLAGLAATLQQHQDAAALRAQLANTQANARNQAAMGKEVNSIVGGRGYLHNDMNRIAAQQNLEHMFSNYKSLDDVPNFIVHEGINTWNTMMSGNSGTDLKLKSLMTPNAKESLAGAMQWVTSNPTGAGQKLFIQQWLKTSRDSAQLAQQRLQEGLSQTAGHYNGIVSPQAQQNIQNGFKSYLKPFAPVSDEAGAISPVQEQNLQTFMKNNPGVSREEAIQALKANGFH